MEIKINDLLKTEKNQTENNQIKSYTLLERKKQEIKGICKMLSDSTTEFKPQKIVEVINQYIGDDEELDRILYSEISAFMFGNGVDDGIIASNLDTVLLYVLDKNNTVSDDERKCVIKIYDHCQLATQQKTYVREKFQNELNYVKKEIEEEVKEEVKEDVKNGIEKEYIAILGIFAAVVIAFVGEMVFSTSVLANAHKLGDIFTIIAVVLMIGLSFANILLALFYFIGKMVKDDGIIKKNFWIGFNVIGCAVILGVVAIHYFYFVGINGMV